MVLESSLALLMFSLDQNSEQILTIILSISHLNFLKSILLMGDKLDNTHNFSENQDPFAISDLKRSSYLMSVTSADIFRVQV